MWFRVTFEFLPVYLRGVTTPLLNKPGIAKRLKIRLRIRIQGRNRNNSSPPLLFVVHQVDVLAGVDGEDGRHEEDDDDGQVEDEPGGQEPAELPSQVRWESHNDESFTPWGVHSVAKFCFC